MDKVEQFLAEQDARREASRVEMERILEERARERELRRENLTKMRDVDGAMARKAMAFQRAVTAQTKLDRESIHDMAQHNPTLLRILQKMGRK